MPFAGFPSGKMHLTRIPAQFFSELLPQIDHLGELKVTLTRSGSSSAGRQGALPGSKRFQRG